MATKMLFIHALTPLHAGTGQGVGVIDLPIAREKATHLPMLPGSSLKGALRARCSDDQEKRHLFGPDTKDASDHAGAVQFSDQRLLLFPVRSYAGTFAWATCTWVLRRFARDAAMAGLNLPALPPAPEKDKAWYAQGTLLKAQGNKVVLEDFDFDGAGEAKVDALADALAKALQPGDASFAEDLKKRLIVLPDSSFDHLVEHATEVVTRIKLQDDVKTVQQGGLWYEENLPAESVLYGLVLGEAVRQRKAGVDGEKPTAEEALTRLAGLIERCQVVQLGGKATVGRGVCRVSLGA